MPRRLNSTLTMREAHERLWDVVVLGAGPAGSMAARTLAENGCQVLLVDRAAFPRSKVCGCCVNEAALGLLEHDERASLERQGVKLQNYNLAAGGRVATVPLSGGISISRERLDTHLVEAAMDRGAEFLDATEGKVKAGESPCRINLQRLGQESSVQCKVAVVATGLAGAALEQEAGRNVRRSSRSYVGGGVLLEGDPAIESGTVSMACHRFGYVGIVRLEDGRIDLAAALDVGLVKRLGGLAHAAHEVITASGLTPPAGMHEGQWHGTVKLTHRRRYLFGDGYLVAGDAAGYVEPFTGEGIAWAMAGGKAVGSFAQRALAEPLSLVGPAWSRAHARLLAPRMRSCRMVSFLLRQPTLVQWTVRTLQVRPQLARFFERKLSRPFSFTD